MMLDTSTNNETVPGASIESIFADGNSQVSAYDVDDLLVRMTVANSNPTFTHEMFGQKKLVIIGSDATNETGLRGFCDSVVGRDEHEIGVCGVCHLDEVSPRILSVLRGTFCIAACLLDDGDVLPGSFGN